MGKMVTISRQCFRCGNRSSFEVDEEGLRKYESGMAIQQAFPNTHKSVRERIMTGACPDCQEKLFNAPYEGHDWGEEIGECECCGAPIWSKDVPKDEPYQCPCCGELHTKLLPGQEPEE